jgi:hypothetical protein
MEAFAFLSSKCCLVPAGAIPAAMAAGSNKRSLQHAVGRVSAWQSEYGSSADSRASAGRAPSGEYLGAAVHLFISCQMIDTTLQVTVLHTNALHV